MHRKVDIAIIGAGTAGISAFKEASKYTNNIVLIDKGPLGSTCARVGCMPSKLLIHVANQFYDRRYLNQLGIHCKEPLYIKLPEALSYVRKMRDHFTSGVIDFIQSLEDQFICADAKFLDLNTLKVGKQQIYANKIIIATGSSNYIPETWSVDHSALLTSDNIFEQKDFASNIAVVGGGIIGLELAQALSRLDVNIELYHSHEFIGGLTDPKVNQLALEILKEEFLIHTNEKVTVSQEQANNIHIQSSSNSHLVESALIAIGRKPNLQNLGLENIGIKLNDSGIPEYDNTTMQIKGMPIYIVGDVNKSRPLLHEAADEGRIAGFNAANSEKSNQCFVRRTPISILFTQPNIVMVGQSFSELRHKEYVIGEVNYKTQGRAKIENKNKGILRVYGDKKTGALLGAECIAPSAEHFAHLLAWAIQQNMTVFDMLQMPFYHPVIEEGVRSALRDMASKVEVQAKPFELAMCSSEAINNLK